MKDDSQIMIERLEEAIRTRDHFIAQLIATRQRRYYLGVAQGLAVGVGLTVATCILVMWICL